MEREYSEKLGGVISANVKAYPTPRSTLQSRCAEGRGAQRRSGYA